MNLETLCVARPSLGEEAPGASGEAHNGSALSQARPMVFKALKFPTGMLALLLERLQLRPQFIEGDEPFSGHVLQTGTFIVRCSQLVSPSLRFSIRVALHPLALPLDKLLEPLP
jgi:hypothetical protein